MKRRGGGDGGRTMAFDAKELMKGPRCTEMEDLCSKLMSLVPQDYKLNDSQQVLHTHSIRTPPELQKPL